MHTLSKSRSSSRLLQYDLSIDDYHYPELQDIDYSYKPKINTHKYNRMYAESINERSLPKRYRRIDLYATMVDECMKNVPDSLYAACYHEIQDYVKSLHLTPDDIMVYPVGLDHPYHITVNESLHRYAMDIGAKSILYADKPYLSKRYIRQSLDSKYHDAYTLDINHVNVKSLEDKTEIFSTVYPTERNLLRFTRDSVLKDPDLYIFEEPSHLRDFVDLVVR